MSESETETAPAPIEGPQWDSIEHMHDELGIEPDPGKHGFCPRCGAELTPYYPIDLSEEDGAYCTECGWDNFS